PGHEAAVSTLAFSPDGSQLVSGGDDDSLKFWDVPNRKLIRSIPFGQKGIAAVNYSADGKTVAATQRHNGTGA
ncbi:WD40 repeat domain-containing protein, partial [Klebsiella pneumoniae]|uniref:WD40 repeat domain-containing protein n=1 Tax=Klebsiella pneumoniae TaxID=573 RepID=UPI003EE30AC2